MSGQPAYSISGFSFPNFRFSAAGWPVRKDFQCFSFQRFRFYRKPRLCRFRPHQFAIMLEDHLRAVARFKRDLRHILDVRHAVGNEGVPQRIMFPREGWPAFAWKHNALRHSFISYRVADIQNVAQVALEAGNSPQMIFKHYRELVRPEAAKAWFSIKPETLKAETLKVLADGPSGG